MQPSKQIIEPTLPERDIKPTLPKMKLSKRGTKLTLYERQGASLVEIVVAIALACILLLWTTIAYSNISKNSVSLNDISTATILAEGQIEYLKTLDYNALRSIPDSAPVTAFSSNPAYGYNYKNVSSSTNSDFYLLTLTINVYKMSNRSTSIFSMDASFLRRISDGKDIGV